MAVLVWDQAGKKTYETGVSRCALFLQNSDGTYAKGEAWNGLTGVTETPSGAEETKLYANNSKYISLRSAEELGGTIEAYTYPESWAKCDGTAELVKGVHIGQQTRSSFGLVYQTQIGNDTKGDDYGYKLHLIYGASVSPSERAYATINDSPEAITFSWEFSTNPEDIPAGVGTGTYKRSSYVEINTTELEDGVENEHLAELLSIVYGSETEDARLPLPSEVYGIFAGTNTNP